MHGAFAELRPLFVYVYRVINPSHVASTATSLFRRSIMLHSP